ncbi:hypothetical protein FACS1894141_3910 [Spirochaetia bacterium]|nr:hypothetical protein FACS1894141_3910 [Spirochaetia bacterium]
MLTTTTGFVEAALLPCALPSFAEQAAQKQAHERRNSNLKPDIKGETPTLTFILPENYYGEYTKACTAGQARDPAFTFRFWEITEI